MPKGVAKVPVWSDKSPTNVIEIEFLIEWLCQILGYTERENEYWPIA